jgi:hypothetical protein
MSLARTSFISFSRSAFAMAFASFDSVLTGFASIISTLPSVVLRWSATSAS